MRRRLIALASGIFGLLLLAFQALAVPKDPLGAAASSGPSKNSCVACHGTSAKTEGLAHDFDDWKASPHGRAGVSCEQCHQGNPTWPGRDQAHAGMLPSTDPKSPVYFSSVPQTCGTCHATEFAAFQRSAHFRELKRSGRGPNCVTCHGAMASRVLNPHDLEITCAICHRSPAPAKQALRALLSSRASLRALESALARARDFGAVAPRQLESLSESRRLYRQASDTWHTFKISDVRRDAEESERISREAANELRMKQKQR